MKKSDFKDHNINDYTPEEVERTGAKLADVQLRTMIAQQTFRTILDRRVGLLVNGMTTGGHKAIQHGQGLAIDSFLYPDDGAIDTNGIFKAALTAGFKGIGIYWNGIQYSFHLDLRSEYGFWAGYKDSAKGVKNWEYVGLLSELSEILLY